MENVNNTMRKQSDMELSGIAKLNLTDSGKKKSCRKIET